MSTQAVAWALDNTGTGPLSPAARLVLIALADYAGPDGRHAFPSLATLAARLDMTERNVRRHVATLRDAGLIRPGDARHVDHIPPYARPNVWDLNLPTPGQIRQGVTNQVGPGGQNASDRGDESVRLTKNLTTNENPTPNPSPDADDDPDPVAQLRHDHAVAEFASSKPAARRERGTCSTCGQDRLLVADGLCRTCLIAREATA